MTLEQLKMMINQKRFMLEDTEMYRLLTLSVQAIEKLEDKLGNESEEIEILA
ncbi:hypothetical protein [Tepidibacter thalassicus]|uniref:Uncharacterized protein n=1 Tax=Tepidibacter thalassicus DSM 15285 TaxID=1123350 RepID=A0A1M5PWY9_9FIRM|nr:hypothetical protein [Tepidibacter thalassicus]SHH06395.1 hypothetical protein SAMN02744040_00657 [Tepidibacter thalassicus DSM 15285]